VVDAGMAHDKPLIIIADEYAHQALEKLFALPFFPSSDAELGESEEQQMADLTVAAGNLHICGIRQEGQVHPTKVERKGKRDTSD